MSIELTREIKKAGKIVLLITGLLLGFVWAYLEKVLPINTKQELTTIYLVQLVSSAIIIIVALFAFIVFLLIWHSKEKPKIVIDKQPDEKTDKNKKQSLEEQFNQSILLNILKFRGLNQIASPKNIATQMEQDTGIILAHLNKLHNDQYVTYQTGGLPPTAATDFFLSPKAFEIIRIEKGQASKSPAIGAIVTFHDPKLDKI